MSMVGWGSMCGDWQVGWLFSQQQRKGPMGRQARVQQDAQGRIGLCQLDQEGWSRGQGCQGHVLWGTRLEGAGGGGLPVQWSRLLGASCPPSPGSLPLIGSHVASFVSVDVPPLLA